MPILIAVAVWQWVAGAGAVTGALVGGGYAIRRWGAPAASEKLKNRKARKEEEKRKAEEERILAIYKSDGFVGVEAYLHEVGAAKNQRHAELLMDAMKPWLTKATEEAEEAKAANKRSRKAAQETKEALEANPAPLKVIGHRARHNAPEASAPESAEG